MNQAAAGRGAGTPRRLALVAIAGVLVAALSYVLLVRTRPGQWIDNWGFEGRKALSFEGRRAVRFALRIVTPLAVVVAVAWAVVIAVARRHWSLAAASVAAVLGAWLSSDALKASLGRPRLLDTIATSSNSLPSGHVLTLTTAALVLVMVTRPAHRGALAAVLSVGMAIYVVALSTTGWHRPSDVIAALGLALAWAGGAALASGADRIEDAPSAGPPIPVPPPWALVALVDAGALAVVVVFRTTVTGATRPLLWAALAALVLATSAVVAVQAFVWALGRGRRPRNSAVPKTSAA